MAQATTRNTIRIANRGSANEIAPLRSSVFTENWNA